MFTKIAIGLVTLLGFSAAGYVWGTSANSATGCSDCCVLMKACCKLGSPCCDGAELPACTATTPAKAADCCPGTGCCESSESCCVAGCCDPGAACCVSGDCFRSGGACCETASPCCTGSK